MTFGYARYVMIFKPLYTYVFNERRYANVSPYILKFRCICDINLQKESTTNEQR